MELKIYKNNAYEMNEKPMVTIETSVFNRKDELCKAMNSVALQSYINIEYIIVDNGSSIVLDDVVNDYMLKQNFPILYIKKPYNGGPHMGRNCGIKYARGKYLAILDSDD